jgi:hypothetical protein
MPASEIRDILDLRRHPEFLFSERHMEPQDELDPQIEEQLRKAARIIWKCALREEEWPDVLAALLDASIDLKELPETRMETVMLDIQKQAKRLPYYFQRLAHEIYEWQIKKWDYR